MNKKKIIGLLMVVMVIFSLIYLKFNFVKVPYLGNVKLLKWDASIDSHIIDNEVYYQRTFNKNQLTVDKIVSYIYTEKKNSNSENLVTEIPSKEEIRKNFKKYVLTSARTFVSGDFLGHTMYKMSFRIQEKADQYIYSISVEK